VPATPTAPAESPPALGQANLKLWVFDEGGIGVFIKQSVKEFETAHPDIQIKVTAYPEDQYGVKVQTAIAAGAAPDLVVVYGPDQMRQGLLLPLDDMVKQYGIDLSTYSQAIVGGTGDYACQWEGKLYCLGSYQGTVQTFYNHDMLAAAGIPDPAPWPPMSVDDFIADACKMTNKDAGIYGAAYTYDILPWSMSFSPDGRSVIGYMNGPTAVHNFGLLTQGLHDGCSPAADLIDPWEQGADNFAEGHLAMVVTDFQNLDKIEAAGINYGSTAEPNPPGVTPYFPVWTDSTGVMASTAHPNEAEAFIAFLTTRGQELQVSLNGNMPLNNAVAQQLNWANGIPGRLDGLEVASHGSIASPYIPNIYDALGAWYTDMDQVVAGSMDIQAAMDDAAPKVQKDLDKVWKTWDAGAASPAP
jgi:ABC-type glycerol-3-phosphate transport system substrate-binding protein